MAGVRGEDKKPGEFRTTQNFIGAQTFAGIPQERIASARYVPPPVPEMNDLLHDLEKGIQEVITAPEDSLPLLVHLALVHYQFEAIHPFSDGNGRVGRLLMPLLLCSHRRLKEPVLYISSFFERNRQDYYDLMLRVSQRGEWTPWIKFFLTGVKECANESQDQAESLLQLRATYHARFQSARKSSLLIKLIDDLFRQPTITISRAAELLDVTHASASANLDKLVKAGIVRERTGRVRNQRFVAEEIVQFLDRITATSGQPSPAKSSAP